MAVKKTQMYRKNLDTSETNLYPLTEAQYVSMENGQTVQEILSDRDSDKYTPVITNSSSTFKVGQGDNVDLSSSMKEGAYDSCVLKGKTMVNCIQEPSSKDVVLPYAFEDGQYVTINDTKESGALGVELKGQTLVNLSSPHNEREIIFNSRYQVYNVTNDVVKGGLKNGEKIFMSMEVNIHEVNIETPNFRVGTCRGTGGYDHITKTNAEICNLPKNTWVRLCAIRDVNEEQSTEQYSFWFGMRGEHPTTAGEQIARVSFRKPVWINLTSMFGKGKEPTLTECEKLPYFTGMSSCKMPTLHTVGKNLADINNSTTNNIDKIYIPCYLVKGNNYTITTNVDYSGRLISIQTINDEEVQIISNWGVNNKQFTFNGETGKYLILIWRGSLISEYPNIQVQLEQSSTSTSYEPYKSSILSLPEEVVLRNLPNGVCDTFNTRTGVYTQRIGEVVLNGSEGDWVSINAFNKTNVFRKPFSLAKNEVTDYETTVENFMTDKLPVVKYRTYDVTNAQTVSFSSLFNSTYNDTAIYINKNSSSNLSEFKTWLSQNPVTVQYELKTPIVTKINLSSTLKSWNTTTHVYSEIPENTLYPTLSHSNPSYPVILKPSTKYSIVANSYSNSHTNSTINFNLGGATASTVVGNRVTTITTPSTLSNELLTMSGRGNKLNNVMVIEGDVIGDEPYFEGICDSKSPILLNCGKNLFDLNQALDVNNWVDYPNKPYRSIAFKVKPKTTYSLSCSANVNVGNKGYFGIFPRGGYYATEDGGWNTSLHWGQSSGVTKTTFTTLDQEVYYMSLYFDSGFTQDNVTNFFTNRVVDIQIEEASAKTAYEPYKSNTTTFNQKDDKTIVLRSLPNGVCDTLNVETGEYVQRIGETSNFTVYTRFDSQELLNTHLFTIVPPQNMKTGSSQYIICDKFSSLDPNGGGGLWDGDKEGFSRFEVANYLRLRILKSKCSTVEELRAWLQSNPITIQYELTKPIVSTIDVQGFPYAYTNGHVQLSSGSIEQSLTPTVEYSLSANKTGQINSNTKRVSAHQKQLDDFEAMMLTQMVQSAYDKAILQFDYEMQMMSLGGE